MGGLLLVLVGFEREIRAGRWDEAGDYPAGPENVVLDWNEAVTGYAASNGSGSPGSGAAACLLAILHGAMSDGIDAADRECSQIQNDGFAALTGVTAAHGVVAKLLPAHREVWDRLLATSVAAMPDEALRARASTLGRQVASHWLERHGYAGAAAARSLFTDEPSPDWIHSARPFLLKRADQIRAAPPDLDRILCEYRRKNPRAAPPGHGLLPASAREVEHHFWSATPEQVWNHTARDRVARQTSDFREHARLFAVLNAGIADGYLAAYESRRYYHDGTWFSLFGVAAKIYAGENSPPEIRVRAQIRNFPDVLAVVSGVVAEILPAVCGGDEQQLEIASAGTVDGMRAFPRLSAAVEAYARAWSRTDRDVFGAGPAGYKQGRMIGRWIAQRIPSSE